jgi:nucleotide-binding universal stress UspA family protein
MSDRVDVGIDRILVPLDGHEAAASALDHAITLAENVDAGIHLLSVVDAYRLKSVDQRRSIEAELEDVIADAAAAVQTAEIPVTTAVEVGFPHKEILNAVADHDADLIAMGTRGRTGLDRHLLGSVAEKVVRLSTVPVLTVGDDAVGTRPYRNILVPTDGSDAAQPAERLGIALAGRFGATVHALSVVPELRIGSRETEDAYEAASRDAIERMKEHGGENTDIRGGIEHGVPHRTILDHCDAVDADLIVLGTHGRTGVERFVLGSVAEKVVRLAERPVLVVPARTGAGTD